MYLRYRSLRSGINMKIIAIVYVALLSVSFAHAFEVPKPELSVVDSSVKLIGDSLFMLAWPTDEYQYTKAIDVTGDTSNFSTHISLLGKDANTGSLLSVQAIIEFSNKNATKIIWRFPSKLLAPSSSKDLLDVILSSYSSELNWLNLKAEMRRQGMPDNEINHEAGIVVTDLIKKAAFLNEDPERRRKWLSIVSDLPLDKIDEFVSVINRENIRYIRGDRNLVRELNKRRNQSKADQ